MCLSSTEALKLKRAQTTTIDTPRLFALVDQLETALGRSNWHLSETLLCVLLRANLVSLFEGVCSSGLGFLALKAATARGSHAEKTNRLARQLVAELSGLAVEFGD